MTINIYLLALLVSLGINLFFFLFASTFKTDKFTDFTYGLTFIVITWIFLLRNQFYPYQLWLALMITAWGIRLIAYLLIRILKIKKDSRFDNMREKPLEFLRFWIFQGITVAVIMLPSIFLLNQKTDSSINGVMIVGAILWIIGLSIETVADWQKYTFKNKPKNKDLWIQSGLWKYSRHPNYFGEIVLWWGLFLYVTPFLQGWTWALILGPLFITFILLFVSGIPLLEKKYDKKYANNKKYQKYKKKTSLLVPLPPMN